VDKKQGIAMHSHEDLKKRLSVKVTMPVSLARRLSLPQVKSKKAKVKSTENYLFNQAAFGGKC